MLHVQSSAAIAVYDMLQPAAICHMYECNLYVREAMYAWTCMYDACNMYLLGYIQGNLVLPCVDTYCKELHNVVAVCKSGHMAVQA